MMNVLVIDDDKVDRLLVREYLKQDFAIYEAESEDQVNNCLDRQPIDCVLLDYLIPGVDSIALLGQIAAKHLPVIMLTGEGNENVAVSAMKHGAQDYISKRNISEDLLTRTITNAVATIKLKQKLDEKQREVISANDQLQRKVQELQTVNNDLENFIHIAAHDLREPLKYLSVYCDVLERDLGANLNPACQENLKSIRRQAKRIATLIDDLRGLTRVAQSKLETQAIDLEQIVAEVLQDFEPILDARHVKVKQAPLPQIVASRPLLVELFRNLIDNALKYGPEKELLIEITAQSDDAGMVFGVKNSGSIIPQTELEHVFQPFYRLAEEKAKEGTGMGLALCRKIVERHSGRIWVESSETMGTHFKFALGSASYD